MSLVLVMISSISVNISNRLISR